MVCERDSLFAVLALVVHLEANRVETTSVRTTNLKISCWQKQ